MDRQTKAVAEAINQDIKRQFDGHPIPGVPDDPTSWAATGGVLNLTEVAQAAIAASDAKLVPMLVEALLYALDSHEGRLTPMHNHWSAKAREALQQLPEEYR